MSEMRSLAIRGVLDLLFCLAALVSWQLVPRLRVSSSTFFKSVLAAFTSMRFGFFAVIFGVFHMQPRGDIKIYMEEALPALAGKLVYRDFSTMHAPLNPYLFSAMLRLHNSPLTIMAFGIAFDVLAYFFWLKAASFFLDSITLRRAALLLLFNPTSFFSEALEGQMNSFIALFLGLAVYLLIRHRNALSGAAVAIPAATIKFLTLIYAPGFLFASRRKVTATIGFAGLLLLVYGTFVALGADITTPVKVEGNHVTSFNLKFLVEMVTGHIIPSRVMDALLGLSWLAVVALVFFCMRAVSTNTQHNRRRTFYILTLSLIAELLCIQILSKNTWDRYLVMAMFPMCVLAAEFTLAQLLAFLVFVATAAFEPSFWALMLRFPDSATSHRYLLAGDKHFYELLTFEFLIVAGHCFLMVQAVRRMLQLRSSATQPLGIDSPDNPNLPMLHA